MAKKNKQTKRAYDRNHIKEVLDSGGDWRMNVVLDNDVMKKVVEEKEKTPHGAGLYQSIINDRLRKAYGLKSKK